MRILFLLLISCMCHAGGYQTFLDNKGVIDPLIIDNTIRNLDRRSTELERYSLTESSAAETYAVAIDYVTKSSITATYAVASDYLKKSSATATYANASTAETLYLRKSSATEGSGSLQIGNQLHQWGWGYFQGSGIITTGGNIVFSTAYTGDPYTVLVTLIGEKVGAPSDIGDFTSPGAVIVVNAYSISYNQFYINIRGEAGVTLASGTNFGYTWYAVGAKD